VSFSLQIARSSLSPLAVVAVLTLPVAGAAERADATEIPWASWRVVGPTNVIGDFSAGADGTTLSTTGPGFEVRHGRSSFVGRFPAELGRYDQGRTPVVLTDGRLVVRYGYKIGTSGNRGRSWRTTTLPHAGFEGAVGPVFTDTRHGTIVAGATPSVPAGVPFPAGRRTGPAVWATADGGRTWRTVVPAEPRASSTRRRAVTRTTVDPSPPVARLKVTALAASADGSLLRGLRIEYAGEGDEPPAGAVERSRDGGSSWQRVWTQPPSARGYGAPTVSAVGALADGRVVLVTDASEDLGTNGRPATLHVIESDGSSRDVASPGARPRLLCPGRTTCLVESTDATGIAEARPFDGQTFGLPRHALPSIAVAPKPGTIVGVARSAPVDSSSVQNARPAGVSSALVTSTDDGLTYRPSFPVRATGVFGDDRALVQTRDDAWMVTRDGRRFSPVPLPPTVSPPAEIRAAPGGLVALFADHTFRRLSNGSWGRPVDVSVLDPSALAVAGNTAVVAGPKGIARIVDGRAKVEVRYDDRGHTHGLEGGPTSDADSISKVAARGREVLAWDPGLSNVLRSSDGGRHWRIMRSITNVRAMQFLASGEILALQHNVLKVSADDGRSFDTAGSAESLSLLDDAWDDTGGEFISFRNRREGIISTENDGAMQTRDGGRTFTPVPRPGGPFPQFARLVGARGLLTDGPLGTIITSSDPQRDLRPTRVRARIERVRRVSPRRVEAVVRGTTSGVPAGTPLRVSTAASPRGIVTTPYNNVTAAKVRGDGTFRVTLRTLAGRVVRLRYGGEYESPRGRSSAVTPWLRVARAGG
jgi:photosystem II stability/assembly factor-like uncharacterized protein